ncbi:MAG: hypothetical protein GX769_02665, partial [Erysipelothrix sp.]|nr:hypothetical protein [Erysipelothrix sp.]
YFTDLLELNQVFVPELLIINRFSVSANGEVIVGTQLSPSDFNVALKTTTEGNILEIIINNPEGDGLQIIFTTSIQGDDSHEIYKNKFKFAVGKDGFEYTSLPATVEIDNGRVHIIKTDELGNPMEGVEFGFFSYPHGYGNNDIGVYLVTDADGKVSTQRLKYGRYYLYESMPSPGYNVADNFMEGAIINVTADDTVEMQTYRISNVPTKTWIYKQNENEKYLDWALFKLELLTEDGYMLISDDLELIEGSILITHLDEGTYRLTEIEATQGYLLNTEPLVFELSRNEDNYLEVNNFIFTNYRGSVQLLKMDEDKLKLEGVMFDLYDDKDVLIKSGLLTNLDGKIVVDDLAPGTYYFKETKTLKGLVLNKAPITFTIKASANGKPEAVRLEVVNDKVVLTPDPTDEQTPTVVDIANPTPTDGKVKGAVKVPTAVEQTKGGQTPKTAISDNTNVFMFVIILSAMYITSIQLKKRFKKI